MNAHNVSHSAYVAPAVVRYTDIPTFGHGHEGLITQAIRDWQRPNQGEVYDRPWKIQSFETLNQAYAKFYNPSEHLAADKVIVKFKGRVIFRQYISIKENVSTSKFINCVLNQVIHMTWECTYVDSCCDSDDMSATHAWCLVSWIFTRKLICVNSAGECVCVWW
jgi:hypothetical protein